MPLFILSASTIVHKHYETQQFCLNELRHERSCITLYDIMNYYYYYYYYYLQLSCHPVTMVILRVYKI